MGFFSKIFGDKQNSSPSKPQPKTAPVQPTPTQNQPEKPAPSPPQPKPQVPLSAPVEPPAPQAKPVQASAPAAPEPSRGEEILMRKYVLTMLSPNDHESREKFLTEFIRRANYIWSPHKIFGRIGLHDDKVRIHIEVQASRDDIEKKMIPWCKETRLYATHAILVAIPTNLSYISHSTPAFRRYDGPWSH